VATASSHGDTDQRRSGLTQQATTRDQVCIEAALDTMAVTGASILHVGVGNSKFAQRFASRARRIAGLRCTRMKRPTQMPWGSLITPCMCSISTVRSSSRSSPTRIDFIIDNNLASFACCQQHFAVMFENYLTDISIARPDLNVPDWHGRGPWRFGWVMTYADLVSLERKFPIHVSKITDVSMQLPPGNDTYRGGAVPCARCISVWWGAVRWRSGLSPRVPPPARQGVLVAVCDRIEERARAAQQRFGARTYYTDLDRFLRESNAKSSST
jgi:hypothetical protein